MPAGDLIGRQVGLQAVQERRGRTGRAGRGGGVVGVDDRDPGRRRGEAQPHLQLAAVAAQVGEQGVVDHVVHGVVGAQGQQRPDGQRHGVDGVPGGGGRVGEPEVDLAAGGEGHEDLQVPRVQVRRAEDREPVRQRVRRLRREVLVPEPLDAQAQALHRVGPADARAEPAPELGLPGAVGGQR